MKNLICLLVLSTLLMFWSCRKDTPIKEVPTEKLIELNVKIEKYGLIYIKNEDVSAVRFNIDFGDGTVISDIISNFTLHNFYKYSANKQYTVTLTTWDRQNNKKVLSKTIKINDVPPLTIADFSYEILDNGAVKFTDRTVNPFENGYWTTSNSFYPNSKEKDPIFVFENNGNYSVSLFANGQSYGVPLKKVSFDITNAKGSPLSIFKGLFINENIEVKGLNTNAFNYSWGTVALSDFFSTNSMIFNEYGSIFLMYGFTRDLKNLTVQEKYNKLKEKFKPGRLSANEWSFRFSKNNYIWQKTDEIFVLAYDPNAQLEIIEVQEVPQAKLIPEMYDKAFWVTFKIKADFGNGNNIDGTLKVRYLIY